MLADSPDCLENDPAWSPDGSQVVFDVACTEETSDAQAGLAVINADGTGWHRIVGPGQFAFDSFPPSHPVWSPDGSSIAFDTESGEGFFGTVYLARADGSRVAVLTDGEQPTWSPDGDRIAFTFQDERDVQSDIYVIGVDGTSRQRLTSTIDIESAPAWQSIVGTG